MHHVRIIGYSLQINVYQSKLNNLNFVDFKLEINVFTNIPLYYTYKNNHTFYKDNIIFNCGCEVLQKHKLIKTFIEYLQHIAKKRIKATLKIYQTIN